MNNNLVLVSWFHDIVKIIARIAAASPGEDVTQSMYEVYQTCLYAIATCGGSERLINGDWGTYYPGRIPNEIAARILQREFEYQDYGDMGIEYCLSLMLPRVAYTLERDLNTQQRVAVTKIFVIIGGIAKQGYLSGMSARVQRERS